jgi:hypothetical protein
MSVIGFNKLERDAGGKPVSTFPHPALERFPVTWNHVTDKKSLQFNNLEPVLFRFI